MSILTRGEVPERLNGPVLKTGGRKSRGFESHPLRHPFVSIVAVGVLLAGCSLTARKFDLSFQAEGGRPALPVVVVDEAGLVELVAPVRSNPPPVIPRGMSTMEASPNAVFVFWTGAECEERATITVSGSDHLTIAVAITSNPDFCGVSGIRREVLIQLTRPVDTSRTTVTFEP